MGKGKGAPEVWVAVDQAGPHAVRDGGRRAARSAREALRLAAAQAADRRRRSGSGARRAQVRASQSCEICPRTSSRRALRELDDELFRLQLQAGHEPAREPDEDARRRGARHRARAQDASSANAARQVEDDGACTARAEDARSAGRGRQRQDGQDGRRRGRSAASSTRKYRKFLTPRTRYKAHDEKNECKVGDRVLHRRDAARSSATSAGASRKIVGASGAPEASEERAA